MNDQQVINRLRSALDEVVDRPPGGLVTVETSPSRSRPTAWSSTRALAVAAAVVTLVGGGIWAVAEYGAAPAPAPSVGTTPQPTVAVPDTTAAESTSSTTSTTSVADGPLLVSGLVRSPDGRPVGGAQVQVFVDPSEEILETLGVGDSYQMTPVADLSTDVSGRFEVHVRSAPLRRFAAGDGFANFTISISHGDDGRITLFSRELTRRGSLVPEEDAPATEDTMAEVEVTAPGSPTPTPPPTAPMVESVVDGAPHFDITLERLVFDERAAADGTIPPD